MSKTIEEEYKFVGLSNPKTIVCETAKQDTFRPNTDNISKERFDALWTLMENGDWSNAKVLISHNGINNGMPVNPIFISVTNI